ncbi:MAG: FecR domain-containing protein [Bacteroidales bacterium]|jgi:ferric-dicitrate binding protein FerR (iron transport regulator)|nr:FecR domain-containing protein [Bacteroidales bacterium]
MDNHTIDHLLHEYFEGRSGLEEQRRILLWLNRSEEHRRYYRECAEIWALQHLPEISDDKGAVLLDTLNRLIARGEKPRRSLWTVVGRIAAIFVLGAAVGYATVWYGREAASGSHDGLYTETTVPKGSRSKIRMPDGTTVWLNAGSRLTCGTNFGKHNRTVLLDGEALFEVAPDSLHPFRIKTKEIDAVVLGTVLTVKAYDDDPMVEITLLKGKTSIEQPAEGKTVALAPNQQAVYDKASRQVSLQPVDAAKYSGWVTGKIYFADEPFEILAKQLERSYDIPIGIRSEKLKKERFFGSFDRSKGIMHILKMIDIDHSFQWSLKNDTLIISDK